MSLYDHPDWLAFVARISAEPDDDTPRLVAADWLDERGDDARAEFIRVQCQIARMTLGELHCTKTEHYVPGISGAALYTPRCRCRACSLRRREYQLGRRHVVWDWSKGIPAVSLNVYERGFVNKITLLARDWIASAEVIRRLHPIQRVYLTNLHWHADEDGAWLDGDRPVPWVDIRAACTPDETAIDDLLPALLRLRWPGVSIIVP